MPQYSASIVLLFVIVTVVSPDNSSFHDHRNKRQLSTDNCPAPIIKNGKFVVLGYNYTQGSPIPNYASVKIFCNENFALFPNKKLITCDGGSWSDSVPECKPTCPPFTSTSVDVECIFNNRTVNCSNPVLDGTVARCKCKEFYVSVNTYQFPTIKCKGGGWDKSLIECEPDCGEGISKGVTNIVKGTAAKFGEFPWHVALYRVEGNKHVYKCGGSIIHPLIIISAAHCFTDNYGEKYPAEEYWVGAGKYYSAYGSPADKLSQTRQVKEYHIPPYYKGFETNFQADLAVVVLTTEFQLSSVVRPVCVDWNREFERLQLISEANGTVVGWGYVNPYNPTISEDLKKLIAPFIEISKCLAVVPQDFTRWVTPDKFCAGLRSGSSVCQGDSGGGMVFPWTVNNKLKYYLRGIVSVGPAEMEWCDSHQYGVYTLVTHYSDFVQDVIANNSEVKTQAYILSSHGSCRIPVLENGKFLYLDKVYTEGYSIPNYSYLRIYCNEDYVLYPEMPYLNCANSTWHIPVPKCKKTCPPLISPLANVSVSCSVDGKTLDCFDSVVEATVAQITCKYGSRIFARCASGYWSERDPFKKCVQESTTCTKENPEFCNTVTTVRPPLEIGSCSVPKIENGIYGVVGHNNNFESFIPNYSVVKFSCSKPYTLTPPVTGLVCLDGAWSTKIPECKRTCPPRISSSSVVTECSVDNVSVNCSKPLVEGAIVRSICRRFYERKQSTQSHVSVCIGGTWDNPPLHCESACGRVPIRSTPLIIGGKLNNVNEFPWHTVIYRYQNGKYDLQCGGSIISRTVVITAAHCVTTPEGALNPINEYYIAAGKSHSTYNSSEEPNAQMRQVKEIHIPSRYKGMANNFVADIAVIVLTKSFELTNVVLPICVDWNRKFERELLQAGAEGKVVGSGSAADDSLKELILPYLETSACLAILSRPFLQWVTTDKFCVANTKIKSSVCRGDSGSGIAFSSNNKYYITGIASVGPTDNGGPCGLVTLFTRMSYYTDWIVNILANNNAQD